jgi:hypothetical protein
MAENDNSNGTTALVEKKPQKIETISHDDSEFSAYLDTAKFNQMWRVATVFAQSALVPAQYRQKPEDCFIAMQMSVRMHVDPMMLMQNTYVVHGKPGMEAKLAIALVNSRGPFTGPIQWRFEGEGKTRSCTAYATHRGTREVCEATVTWEMAEREGWTKKEGSKWLTMPDMMFRYRSATFLARLYAPECLMGMSMIDELLDIAPAATVAEFEPITEQPGTEGLKARLAAKTEEPDPATEAAKQEQIEALKAAEAAEQPAEEVPAETPQECRYLCMGCSHEFDKPKKGGLCPKCLSNGIVDRQAAEAA